MSIQRADSSHLAKIEALFSDGRHIYSKADALDLSSILQDQLSLVGTCTGRVWGFLSVEQEERPPTLPEGEPNRSYISQVALASDRSAFADIPKLLTVAMDKIASFEFTWPIQPTRLTYFGNDTWLINALREAQFEAIERVEFMEMERVQRRKFSDSPSSDLTLRLAQHVDIEPLAWLDAAVFSSLWHMSATQLAELWTTHRICVAFHHTQLVGYTAISRTDREHGQQGHLARIATHPAHRGKGVGRRLLVDALQFMQQQGVQRLTLNTQTSNKAARALYKSVGFSRTGISYRVLARTL